MSENNLPSNDQQPYQSNYRISEEVTSIHETIRITQQRYEIQRYVARQVNNYTPNNGVQDNFRSYGQVSSASFVIRNDGRYNSTEPGPSHLRSEYDAERQQANPTYPTYPSYVVPSDSERDENQGDDVYQSRANYTDTQNYTQSNDNQYDPRDESDAESMNERNDPIDLSDTKGNANQDDAESTDGQDDAESTAGRSDVGSADDQDDAGSADDQDDAGSADGEDDSAVQSGAESATDQDDDVGDRDNATSALDLGVAGSDESTLLQGIGVQNNARNYKDQSSNNQYQLGADCLNVPNQEKEMTDFEGWKYLYEVRLRESATLRKKLTQTRTILKDQKVIANQLMDICNRYDARNDASNREIESLTSEARESRKKMEELQELNLALTNDASQFKTWLVDLQATQRTKEQVASETTSFYETLLKSTEARHDKETTFIKDQMNTLNADLEKKNSELIHFFLSTIKNAELKSCRLSMDQLRAQLRAKSDNEQLLNEQLRSNLSELREFKSGDVLYAKLTTAFMKDFSNLLAILLHNEPLTVSSVAKLHATDPAAFDKLMQHVRETCKDDHLQLRSLATLFSKVAK